MTARDQKALADACEKRAIRSMSVHRGIWIVWLTCGHDVSLVIEPGADWMFHCPVCIAEAGAQWS